MFYSIKYNMNLFGKAKTAQTTPKDAIIKLRESLEMLEKREKYLEQKIQAELKVAKANATKNKRGRLSNQEGGDNVILYIYCIYFSSCPNGFKEEKGVRGAD